MQLIAPELRKENACRCMQCKHMCMRSPCFPAPEEVEKLVESGYGDKVMLSIWFNVQTGDGYQLVAPKRLKSGACVFVDLQTGLCTLHDKGLKPLEGRLSHHDAPDNGLREWICKKWNSETGRKVISEFVAREQE